MAKPAYETHEHDVIVIGAGGAGLRAAIEAAAQGVSVGLICKSLLGKAHTVMAEGGIAAAMGNVWPRGQLAGPLPRHHARRQDAQQLAHGPAARPGGARAGAGAGALGGPVRSHQGRADLPARLRRPPLRAAGPRGRPHRPGDDPHAPVPRHPPGHRRLHGVQRSSACSRTAIGSRAPSATGARTARCVVFKAKAVVLATGGIGKAWKVTSNSWEYTGDGHSLALWAGADLIDMEFVQFHPTGMVWPPSVRGILVTESVRGDGGTLKNNTGERFMFNYIPEFFKGETADNDRGSRALVRRQEEQPAHARPAAARRGGPGHQLRDQGGAGVAARRRLPRHLHAAVGRLHQEAAAVDVPPVQGAGGRGHHQGADGGRADAALRDGRRARERRLHRGHRARALRRRRVRRAACTAATASAATRSPTCWCSAGAPGCTPRSTPRTSAASSPSTPGQVESIVREALEPFERAGGENPYAIQADLQDTMQALVGLIRTESELKEAIKKIEVAQGAGGQGRGSRAAGSTTPAGTRRSI